MDGRVVAFCGVLLATAWAGFWWWAVPRHQICVLTMPAPPGCGSGRVPVAAVWSVVTGGFYGVLLLVAARSPRSRWGITAIVGLVVGAVWGFIAVVRA